MRLALVSIVSALVLLSVYIIHGRAWEHFKRDHCHVTLHDDMADCDLYTCDNGTEFWGIDE